MFDELAEQSWTVQKDWLSMDEVRELRIWGQDQRRQNRLRPAGIGPQAELQAPIRGDQILWLQPGLSPSVDKLGARLEKLRLELNRELYLGLESLEWHLAVYPPGEGYQAHIDQPRHRSAVSGNRRLSMVVYLNQDWGPDDGGELCIFDPHDPSKVLREIPPRGGSLVLFRSESVLHAVKPAKRERWSLTGWFRR